MRGRLFVLSGPAGVGKGTILTEISGKLNNLVYSVSCTTREPRPGEVNGQSYYFISEEEFMKTVEDGELLEWARVHGHYYGTRRDIVERSLEAGLDVLLEIDVQGAKQVKKKIPEAVMVFVQPPSFEELVRRLKMRRTETPGQLDIRIENAKKELLAAGEYEHMIINDNVSAAARDFIEIIKKYRGKSK